MGHNYTLPTIKLLFATARTCAYPGCQLPLVFEDSDRGIRSVAVQIAHIRSPKITGPRHDPAYPAEKFNAEENLLLLCGKHHHPVDGNDSEYTIEELIEWKKGQVTDSGGFIVPDEDIAGLAAALQASIDGLRDTRPGSGSRPRTESADSCTGSTPLAASPRSGSGHGQPWATATGCAENGPPGQTCRSGNRELAKPGSEPGSANQADRAPHCRNNFSHMSVTQNPRSRRG